MELGIKNPIGGIGNKNQILHKTEIVFSEWLAHAQQIGLEPFKISEIRSLTVLQMQRLLKCNTPSTDCRDMKLFLKQNPY